jgi:hypothetical protein
MPAEPDVVRVTVDGHDFLVRARTGEPGVYDFDWLTGPRDYGFSVARSDRSPMSRPEAEESIRDFLTQINPATGYID